MPPKRITWTIDLSVLMRKKVRIETKEGHIRNGVLTDIEWNHSMVDWLNVSVPMQLIIDNEVGDPIPFVHIKELVRVFPERLAEAAEEGEEAAE